MLVLIVVFNNERKGMYFGKEEMNLFVYRCLQMIYVVNLKSFCFKIN